MIQYWLHTYSLEVHYYVVRRGHCQMSIQFLLSQVATLWWWSTNRVLHTYSLEVHYYVVRRGHCQMSIQFLLSQVATLWWWSTNRVLHTYSLKSILLYRTTSTLPNEHTVFIISSSYAMVVVNQSKGRHIVHYVDWLGRNKVQSKGRHIVHYS
jgi:hypothetical protein